MAFERFARIHVAPLPDDLTVGNVMVLDPFHVFSSHELARFITTLLPETGWAYDAQAELATSTR